MSLTLQWWSMIDNCQVKEITTDSRRQKGFLFLLLDRSAVHQWERGDMTTASISEVTAKRTSLLVRVPSTCKHSVPCQPVRERERQREALPAERCPRCHGLVWEVTDSACVSVWRENKTAEKCRGPSSWPFVLPGSISLCASDNNFKRPRLPEPLTGVCVCMCGGVHW